MQESTCSVKNLLLSMLPVCAKFWRRQKRQKTRSYPWSPDSPSVMIILNVHCLIRSVRVLSARLFLYHPREMEVIYGTIPGDLPGQTWSIKCEIGTIKTGCRVITSWR